MDLFVKIVFLLFYWCECALVPLVSSPQDQVMLPHTAVPSWALEHRATKAWFWGDLIHDHLGFITGGLAGSLYLNV